ncbi:hypothetical protein, partial [Acinetobacter baumannii]|uniref:hypothetical protein n=1 Tax=Acinetobacter baumannii TaxID=470 RepID=UPI0033964A8F
VFAMASLWCLVLALGPRPGARRVPWAALAGAALAASALCKQTGLALLLPYALWIAAAVVATPELSARERRAIPLAFALGTEYTVYACDSRAHAIELLRQLDAPPPLALVDLGLPPAPHAPDE